MSNAKIDPKKNYSLYEIVQGRLIPGVFSITVASNRVKSDFFKDNILKAKVVEGMRGRTYKIKGENIIKYLKKHG